MLDIILFRVDKGGNPDLVRESQRRRCKDPAVVDKVIELDQATRQLVGLRDTLNKNVGDCSKAIGAKKKAKEADGDDLPLPEAFTDPLKERKFAAKEKLSELNVTQLKALSKLATELVAEVDAEAKAAEKERDQVLGSIGNIVHEDCLPTKDEEENQTVHTFKGAEKKGLGHVDLMEKLGMHTGDKVTKIGGGRAFYLTGGLVQLQFALNNFSMNFMTQKQYTPIYPPYFMTKDMMAQVAQLDQFDEELYKVTGEGDDKYLIATSEQPIGAFHMNQYYSEKDLPKRWVGFSTCFRKEVGAHGRDTLGIFRVHQFEKIEQFCVTTDKEQASWKMMDEMILNAREFYEALGLPYRQVRIVAGALNNAAAMKYDLEGWFPGAGKYKELVSCSNCTDYQSRRLAAKMASQKKGGPQEYVHMLNSTLCAITRVMCAICENYQTDEGIVVPEVLRPYMGGTELIPFVAQPADGKKADPKKK